MQKKKGDKIEVIGSKYKGQSSTFLHWPASPRRFLIQIKLNNPTVVVRIQISNVKFLDNNELAMSSAGAKPLTVITSAVFVHYQSDNDRINKINELVDDVGRMIEEFHYLSVKMKDIKNHLVALQEKDKDNDV